MKKELVLGVMLTSTLLASQVREVESFDAIEISGGGKAYIVQGMQEKVEVDAKDSIQKYIKTEVRNGRLYIEVDKPWYKFYVPVSTKNIKYYIDVAAMKELELNGSIDAEVDGIKGEELQVDINGSSDLELHNLAIGNLEIKVSGSGDIEAENLVAETIEYRVSGSGEASLEGKADSLSGVIKGSGSIDAENFLVNNAKIKISGSGEARVNVNETLDGSISGSGDIYYKGEGNIGSIEMSGSGKFHRLD